jgi:Tol biopolymer transport system component
MSIQRRVLLTLGVAAVLVPMLLWQRPVSGASAPVNPEVVFVATSSTPEIGLTNAYGTGTTTIDVAAAGGAESPVLAPNGAEVAFISNCDLYTVSTDGSNLTELPKSAGEGCLAQPAWSPNSEQLAFDSTASDGTDLWVANADGSHAVEIAPGGESPTWAPDGSRIAYIAFGSGGSALSTISPSGGAATVLTSDPPGVPPIGFGFASPAWSPDGTTIAYVSWTSASISVSSSFSMINVNGTQNRVLGGLGTGEGGIPSPLSWCPNGRCLLVGTSLDSGGSATGGFPIVPVTGLTNVASAVVGMPILSTDGFLSSSIPVVGTQGSWIGVQGPTAPSPQPPPTVGAASTSSGNGLWTAASDGGVFTFGDAQFLGSMGGKPLNAPVVGMASTPSGDGYWEVASDGGIFSFGDADFYGSMGGKPLNKPVVGMASDPATGGYWEVASDGGVFSFNAPFFGSAGGIRLNKPVVGMAATPDGRGYWLVASDGGIFAYGDAGFYGSTGGTSLNQPVTGMTSSPGGGGYWLVGTDGGIFSFGAATFEGSAVPLPMAAPVIALVPAASTGGYREVTAGGGSFNFAAQLG